MYGHSPRICELRVPRGSNRALIPEPTGDKYTCLDLPSTTTKTVLARYVVLNRLVNGLGASVPVLDQPLVFSKTLGSYKGLTKVEAYEVCGEWIRVKFEGTRGYIRTEFQGLPVLRRLASDTNY
jgi:hypothetical protein